MRIVAIFVGRLMLCWSRRVASAGVRYGLSSVSELAVRPTATKVSLMLKLFLLPGDLLCNAFGLRGESDHRQVLRSFFNMMFWSAICIVED